MMTTIFDCETEIGQCDSRWLELEKPVFGESCTIYAHTIACLSGSNGMLKIEQRCYLRLGEELPDQPWVKPEMILEPAICPERELIKMARQFHQQFIAKVRSQLPEELAQ
jgi:hypothetical protein